MYAGDEPYLNSQNDAKSSLQALLKAREIQSSSETQDQGKDFNYSQKLFHIADGNLYSIFSPIQGRSYGMKPSFLRKQKYTVQECRNRGHKNIRKGLKFHNFLPSESVTSEKDNGYLRKWKVHSECRLQEEHGTKQITISNWSQSAPSAPSEHASVDGKSKALSNGSYTGDNSLMLNKQNGLVENPLSSNQYFVNSIKSESNNSSEIIRILDKKSYDQNCFTSSSERAFPSINNATAEAKKHSECSVSRKSILDNVLSSLRDSPSSYSHPSCDEAETCLRNEIDSQKHRRKPVCTRRIVPYTKYLSLIEQTESAPLDLSSKCFPEITSSPALTLEDSKPKTSSSESHASARKKNNLLKFEKNNYLDRGAINVQYCSSDLGANISDNSINTITKTSSAPVQNKALTLYPLSVANQPTSKMHSSWPQLQPKDKLMIPIRAKKQINSFNPPQEVASNSAQSQLSNFQYTFQKPFIRDSPAKPRRRSQRSVIKQKLEDTFKQNGFLVKTKQVSDGEATFCKFRQLRKYTRYYLKSWQQHLPDEVHKMWKGFLPPKTVIPPIPNLPESSHDPS